MASFGERLRREREMRGIKLEEIAAATKIGTRSLKALEDEEFNKLPGGIFNKGFVRAYAKFLGINEEQAVADYMAASGQPEEPAPEVDAAQMLAQREEVEKKSKAASKKAKELQSVQRDGPSGFPWAPLLGLVLIVLLAWGGRVGYYKYRAHQEAQEQAQREAQAKAQAEAAAREAAAQQAALAAQAVPQPQTDTTNPSDAASQTQPGATGQPATQPAGSSTATPQQGKPAQATEQVQPSAGNFVVSIRARQKVWVSIMADGKRVMSGELEPSTQRTVQAREHIVLRTGNAGGTDVALNGKPLPSLGAENQVRTVTINADGSVQ